MKVMNLNPHSFFGKRFIKKNAHKLVRLDGIAFNKEERFVYADPPKIRSLRQAISIIEEDLEEIDRNQMLGMEPGRPTRTECAVRYMLKSKKFQSKLKPTQ